MRRHLGSVIFTASLLMALVAYFSFVKPVQRESAGLVDRIKAVNLADLELRVNRTKGRDEEALRRLERKLDQSLPAPEGLWKRLGLEDQPDATAFKALFTEWHNRMMTERVLAAGAWPRAAWHSGPTIPSIDEKRATARLMLFIQSLGRAAHTDSGARILRVRSDAAGKNVGLDFEFDPTKAGGLLDAVLCIHQGGEPFRLLDLTTNVAESGAATGRIRLALIDPE